MSDLEALFPKTEAAPVKRKRPDYYTRGGPGKRPRFASFDFETDGLGGKVIAASYYTEAMLEAGEEPGYIRKGDIVQKLFWIMCNNPEFHWFAHNMQYEARYFIERLEEIRERVQFFLRTDSDVFMITIDLPEIIDKNGKPSRLVIRDSMALWDRKLEEFASQFCPEKPKLNINFDVTTFNPIDPEHIAYSKRDSETLLLSLMRFDQLLFETFDVHIRSTAASTAMAAWQRTLSKDERYYNSKTTEDFIRTGYYGGFVFLTETRKYQGAKTFDRNSSYPAEMLDGRFPEGAPVRSRLLQDSYLGLYDVTVSAPEGLIVPILPKRDDKGIVWPAGTFRTTVTTDELRFARQHGYVVHTVHDGLLWHTTCNPFHLFVSRCRNIRFAHPQTALDAVAKRMQNSLYGKFGAKRLRRKLYTSLPQEEQIGCEPWGDYLIKEEYAEDMQCMPQWAVFITARARLSLMAKIYEVGPDNVIYGDTDSITVKPGFEIAVGKAYGDWKLEKTWDQFRARGPKIYAGIKAGSNALSGAAKGIPRSQWTKSHVFDDILGGTTPPAIEYKSLEKFVQALKTRHIGQRDAHRNLSSLANSRSWRLEPDGGVRPRPWSEIEALGPAQRRSSEGGIERVPSPRRGSRAA